LVVLAGFFFLYLFMPNTRVRPRSALGGGLVGAAAFQLTQYGLILFQSRLTRYNTIYGAFGAVLVLLLWVYLSWCIFLWGAEISSAHQNLRNWRRQRRAWRGTPAERETLALRLAALLAAPMLDPAGRPRLDEAGLADALRLPLAPVSEMAELFRQAGLLIQSADDGGCLLARAPEGVSVLDVLRLARTGRLAPAGGGGPLAEEAGRLRSPLAGRPVSGLAGLPLEEIQTLPL
jgi:membrane protein